MPAPLVPGLLAAALFAAAPQAPEVPPWGVNLFPGGRACVFSPVQGRPVPLPPVETAAPAPPPESLVWAASQGEGIVGLGPVLAAEGDPGGGRGPAPAQRIWTSAEGRPWTLLGTLEPDLAHAKALIPLEENRFFLVASYGFFQKGDRAAPCCIARLEPRSGVIAFEALVDLDFEGPPLRLQAGTSKPLPGPTMAGQYEKHYLVKAMQLADTLPLRQAGERFVLWSDHFGWFWIFDAKGTLQRRTCLVPALTEKDIPRRWDYEWVVLAAQPTAEGTLRVAARSQDAVLKARGKHPLTLGDPAQLGLNARFAREDHPEVEWWDLDLETGRFRSVAAPAGAPRHLLEAGGESAFRFVVLADGTLAFPNFQPRLN